MCGDRSLLGVGSGKTGMAGAGGSDKLRLDSVMILSYDPSLTAASGITSGLLESSRSFALLGPSTSHSAIACACALSDKPLHTSTQIGGGRVVFFIWVNLPFCHS